MTQKYFRQSFCSVVAGVILLLMQSVVVAQPIRVLYEEGADSIGTYCMGMLELALSRFEHNYTVQPVTGNRTAARAIEDVRDGVLDVVWGSSDAEIESTLQPVRIPLYKGLLGHRIFIIRQGDQYKFNHINTLADLKQVTLGQGSTWADTKILQENGLPVIPVYKYPSLFYMLDGDRFDAFPRGLQEPWAEIAARPELALAVEQRLMLMYRMPFYLYVSKNNPQLAADLERGFNLAIEDGSFDEYFLNDPTVKDALERSNIENRVIIELQNPSLPKSAPIHREELWLNPAGLKR